MFGLAAALRKPSAWARGQKWLAELPNGRHCGLKEVKRVQDGEFQILLVHHDEGAYQHYDSVECSNGEPWVVNLQMV